MKLCQDCRWIAWVRQTPRGFSRDGVDEGHCHHPKSALKVTDYVTGAEAVEYPSCQLARTIGACKPEGLLWEAQT